MGFSEAAWERAMRLQEVMLKALAGEIHWFRAAEILGMHPRSLRRWREHYERHGYDGLLDRRRHRPSPRRAPLREVEKVLRLYRETYRGFNVRHFHQTVKREHGVKLSYSLVKKALQEAGLVRRKRTRGRHRLRREPRLCFGEMLHIDGSLHAWLALCPEERLVMITIVDDASSRLLYAQLWPGESTRAVLSALHAVVSQYGIPGSLYSDRASWAFETPQAGGAVDKSHLTRVGEVLRRLGVEHIPSYSPQARGRSERVHRTLQDRLVNELRVEGITSIEVANRYIRERHLPVHNDLFSRPPTDPASGFASAEGMDLQEIFYEEVERVVAKDNTVAFEGRPLQISPQPGRRSCAGVQVWVRRHLDGTISVRRGVQVWGRYSAQGPPRSGARSERGPWAPPGTTISRQARPSVDPDSAAPAPSGTSRPVEAAGPVDAAYGRGAHKDLGRRRNGRRRPQLPQAPAAANP